MIDDPQVQLIHDLLAFTEYRGFKGFLGHKKSSEVGADALASDMAGMSISRQIEVPLQKVMAKLKYVGEALLARTWTFDGGSGDTVFRYTCSPKERQLVQRYVSGESDTLFDAPTRAQHAPTTAQKTLLLGDAFKKLCQLLNELNLDDHDKQTVERYKRYIIDNTRAFDIQYNTQLASYLEGALNTRSSLPANVVVVTEEKPMSLSRSNAFSRKGSVVEPMEELSRSNAFSRSGSVGNGGSVGNAKSSLG